MKNILPLFSIFLLLFNACQPLKNHSSAEYPLQPITKENFQLLNGTYHNFQDTVFGKIIHLPERGLTENDRSLVDRLCLFPTPFYKQQTWQLKRLLQPSITLQ